ncbi:MAG: hypothetical protein FWE94_06370 [Coriobacteriia bacterium]|nr:hypothetical protein [Coriobacteriia bacterium]
MGMIPKYEELQALSDEELIVRYDAAAKNAVAGTQFYQDALLIREQARQNKEMLRLTCHMRNLTFIVAFFTLINLIIAIILVCK